MDDERLTLAFSDWFKLSDYDEQHRAILQEAWTAALDSAINELNSEWHWLLENLKA